MNLPNYIYTYIPKIKKLSSKEFSFFYDKPAQNLMILVQASSKRSIDVA